MADDFYEDDEPKEDVMAAFDAGEKQLTGPPLDPIGTRTVRESSADAVPHAYEMVSKHYPDGTWRLWYRQRGGPWQETSGGN